MNTLVKIFIFSGLGLIVMGLLLNFSLRFKLPLGKFPGDILVAKKNLTVYFPLTTCLLVSIVGSVLIYFFSRR